MKFAVIIEYNAEHENIKAHHSAHREYLRSFLENGQLWAAGPFAKNTGALWILDADNLKAAEEIVKADPYVAAGVIVNWQLRPIAYWSAREAKGLL
jgi:uncharacterized protein